MSWLFQPSIEFLRYYFWVNEIFLFILNERDICTLQGESSMIFKMDKQLCFGYAKIKRIIKQTVGVL